MKGVLVLWVRHTHKHKDRHTDGNREIRVLPKEKRDTQSNFRKLKRKDRRAKKLISDCPGPANLKFTVMLSLEPQDQLCTRSGVNLKPGAAEFFSLVTLVM